MSRDVWTGQEECVNIPGYPGVVPGADTCLRVEEVHLALHRRPLLCLDTIRSFFRPSSIKREVEEQQNLPRDVCVKNQTGTDRILPAGQVVGGREVCSGGCGRVLASPALWSAECGSPDWASPGDSSRPLQHRWGQNTAAAPR